ncbi:MAG: hypothetical protein E7417_00640 [Ruminococcaceae bacterium]|nr:hypothetical protein [Oscillospiraceae bacterium]
MKSEYRRKSLKYRILFLLISAVLVLSLLITFISGYVYSSNMLGKYQDTAVGISKTLATSITADTADSWLNEEKVDSYNELLRKIDGILDTFSKDIKIHVYKPTPDNLSVIFDSNGVVKGDSIPYTPELSDIKPKMLRGESVSPVISQADGSPFITAITPVTDSSGDSACYVICELGIGHVYENRNSLMSSLLLELALLSVLLVVAINFYISRRLIIPLNKIDIHIRKFAADNSCGDEVTEKLKNLNDNNLKEIDEIRNDFITLSQEVGIQENEIKEIDEKIMKRMKNLYGTDGESMYDI